MRVPETLKSPLFSGDFFKYLGLESPYIDHITSCCPKTTHPACFNTSCTIVNTVAINKPTKIMAVMT